MKVLVTGATGFIGFHVARVLKQKGLHVVALVRKGSDSSPLESLGVEAVEGDVRDYDSVCRASRDASKYIILQQTTDSGFLTLGLCTRPMYWGQRISCTLLCD